ncbi:hypothetical protein SAMN05421856_104147 [Chryseobacterium taichungense]|uniref:Uncharacterized protein n=1 Tax=Chryseobacterium taichungense TaxID=295069 RepID=A0A1H7ZAU6_9FLAO|nr:hypothetical protein [Chryseobacterium taichungense]SEM55395.1 hypothetical protein SAMN05421856_104147 [Chryseobacterium taichungense]
MRLQQEEYVPMADVLLRSFSRDLSIFEAENHLFNSEYLQAMQSKTDEVRAKEAADLVLAQQMQSTEDLYILGDQLNKPLKILNMVIKKANIKTSVATDILNKIKKRNFEGALMSLNSLKQIVSAQSALLQANGMKADMLATLEDAFTAITTKSNEQTAFQQQRKAFTSTNKHLYKELYKYISEVAKLGKIIFSGEQKASEYTIDHILAMLHASKRTASTDSSPKEES